MCGGGECALTVRPGPAVCAGDLETMVQDKIKRCFCVCERAWGGERLHGVAGSRCLACDAD